MNLLYNAFTAISAASTYVREGYESRSRGSKISRPSLMPNPRHQVYQFGLLRITIVAPSTHDHVEHLLLAVEQTRQSSLSTLCFIFRSSCLGVWLADLPIPSAKLLLKCSFAGTIVTTFKLYRSFAESSVLTSILELWSMLTI